MKKSLIALLISSVLVLSACDDQVQQKLLEAEKKIVQLETDYQRLQNEMKSTKSAFPALQVEIVTLFEKSETIKHPKDPKDEYSREESTISVKATTAKTGVEWLDQLLLQALHSSYLEQDEQNRISQTLSQAEMVKFFADLYQELETTAKQDKPIGFEESAISYYVGQRNNIVTFSQFLYRYQGGAHGGHRTNYLNIDINKKAVITLNDLIPPKNQPKLKTILWSNYVDSRAAQGTKEDELFMPKSDFFISENFYFEPDGIVFVYPLYSLGPYVEGEGKLMVEYYQLEELMNPDYFPK